MSTLPGYIKAAFSRCRKLAGKYKLDNHSILIVIEGKFIWEDDKKYWILSESMVQCGNRNFKSRKGQATVKI